MRDCGAGRRRSRCSQMDDFILWVTHRHHPRRPHRLCAVLQFALLHPASGRDFRIVEGRHVVSWRLHRLRRRGDLFCRHNNLPILSLGDITTAVGPIGLFLGRIANFINSELWGRPADPSLPWAMIFPNGGPLPRHPSQLYEAGTGGHLAVHDPRRDDPLRRLEAAGTDPRQPSSPSTAWHGLPASVSGSPTRSSDFCGAG